MRIFDHAPMRSLFRRSLDRVARCHQLITAGKYAKPLTPEQHAIRSAETRTELAASLKARRNRINRQREARIYRDAEIVPLVAVPVLHTALAGDAPTLPE